MRFLLVFRSSVFKIVHSLTMCARMNNGDVHNASTELAGKYEGGKLVSMGKCDFPRSAENDRDNVFRFYVQGSVVGKVNLTLCEAPRPRASGRVGGFSPRWW